MDIKCVFRFSLLICSEIFPTLRRVQLVMTINMCQSSCTAPLILVRFQRNLCFLDRTSKNISISDCLKIRPVGAELFFAD